MKFSTFKNVLFSRVRRSVSQAVTDDEIRALVNLTSSVHRMFGGLDGVSLQDVEDAGLMSSVVVTPEKANVIWSSIGQNLIKSASELEYDEEEDGGGDFEPDLGSTPEEGGVEDVGGGEEVSDFGEEGGGGMDDDFMGDVNDIDAFGEDAPELSGDDVSKALQAIAKIAGVVLGTQGIELPESEGADTEGYVLDTIEELADGAGGGEDVGEEVPGFDVGEEGLDEEPVEDVDTFSEEEVVPPDLEGGAGGGVDEFSVSEEEDIPDEIAASVVRVISAPRQGLGRNIYCSVEEADGKRAVVLSGADISVKTAPVLKSGPVDTLVLHSSVESQNGVISLNQVKGWIRQGVKTRWAWKSAFSGVSRALGHRPKTAAEYAAVYCAANRLVGGLLARPSAVVGAIRSSGSNPYDIKRVVEALRNSAARGNEVFSGGILRKGVMAKLIKSGGEAIGGSLQTGKNGEIDKRGFKPTDSSNLPEHSRTNKAEGKRGYLEGGKPDGNDAAPDGRSAFTSDEVGGESGDIDSFGLSADGVLDAREPGAEYDFNSSKIATVEVPIEGGKQDTQVLKLKEVSQGVYILDKAFIASGRGGRCSFYKGADALAILRSGTRPSKIVAKVDGRAVALGVKGDTGRAVYLKSSPILGVVAIEAPFKKGFPNSEYSVFSRVGEHLVDGKGNYFRLPVGPNRVIASAVSLKSVMRGGKPVDVLSSVESAYVRWLKSCVAGQRRRAAQLKEKLTQAVAMNKKQAALHQSALAAERKKYQEMIRSGLSSIDSLRRQTADVAAAQVFSSAREDLAARESERMRAMESGVDQLLSLYF